jgi:dipeptidase E
MKGAIILTSTGLFAQKVRQAAKKFFDNLPHKSVAIITTAAEGKENNKYSKLAESQFKELCFNVIDFVDLENNHRADFSKYNVIYVCGGNTFKLLKYAREANFKETIVDLLDRGGIYIGVSAGAIILSPTIQMAAYVNPDPNDVGPINLEIKLEFNRIKK